MKTLEPLCLSAVVAGLPEPAPSARSGTSVTSGARGPDPRKLTPWSLMTAGPRRHNCSKLHLLCRKMRQLWRILRQERVYPGRGPGFVIANTVSNANNGGSGKPAETSMNAFAIRGNDHSAGI